MNMDANNLVGFTRNDGKILISNYTKKYEGTTVMKKDDKKRLKNVEKNLDKTLTLLDSLRCKTEQEEKRILRLLHQQRLLKEKLD